MDMNDVIQWVTIGVIFLIVLVVVIRKMIRFRKELRDGGDPSCGCGCGCSGCRMSCDLQQREPAPDNKKSENKDKTVS